MRLEHINLVVTDIDASLAFYRAAFPHWRVRGEGNSPWYGKPRNWLHFGDDESYITLNDNGEGENRDLTAHQPGLAHFGYETDNLDALVKRLSEAGFEAAKDGAGEPYRTNIYYIDPAGFEVEFVEYHSDLPEERNRYAA